MGTPPPNTSAASSSVPSTAPSPQMTTGAGAPQTAGLSQDQTSQGTGANPTMSPQIQALTQQEQAQQVSDQAMQIEAQMQSEHAQAMSSVSATKQAAAMAMMQAQEKIGEAVQANMAGSASGKAAIISAAGH